MASTISKRPGNASKSSRSAANAYNDAYNRMSKGLKSSQQSLPRWVLRHDGTFAYHVPSTLGFEARWYVRVPRCSYLTDRTKPLLIARFTQLVRTHGPGQPRDSSTVSTHMCSHT